MAGSPNRAESSDSRKSPRTGVLWWPRLRPACSSRSSSRFYVDLSADPDQPATPIHLGFRGGRNIVFRFLDTMRAIGVNHVILNLKYGTRDAGEVLEEIGRKILPQLAASSAAAQPPP
jgi:hypothetical protein